MKVLLTIGTILCIAYAIPIDVLYPELDAGYFEGDIVLGNERIGLVNEKFRWPNGEVPYEIEDGFTQHELDLINAAFNQFQRDTCIKFRSKTSADKDYLYFQKKDPSCYSSIGNRGKGKQIINLESPKCFNQAGTIVHELMHCLGFYHEHSRRDRNDFVTVIQDNINMDFVYNFVKYDVDYVTEFGIPYDYNSIMHYPRNAFSKNGKDTIVPKDPNAEIGQRESLSAKDVARVGKMYKCPGF